MIQIKLQEHSGPLIVGHWRAISRDGDWIIKMTCPLCGTEADLGDHEIDESGNVSPSVKCPSDLRAACDFHDSVQLERWDP